MKSKLCALLLLGTLLLTPAAPARSRKNRGLSPAPGSFDYYLLALSWAPEWCAEDASRANSPECTPGKHIGFIVHGFWPEVNQGQNPEFCGTASRVPNSSMKVALPLMLSANLVQHEWAAHGTCSGLNVYDYFTGLAQARGEVQVPVQLNSAASDLRLSPLEIEAQFRAANSAFPKDAFRTACTRGALEEERICFNKSFKPQSCTANVAECQQAKVDIPPAR